MRQAVRALVVDPARHVLLVHFDFDDQALPGGFWACPGGGVEDGEGHEEALRRELVEEVGLDGTVVIGPHLWTKSHVFPMTHWDGQDDHIYLVEVDRFEPTPRLTWEQLRDEGVDGVRWFSPDELAAGEHTFGPRLLPSHLETLWRDGPPPEPLLIPAP